MIKFLCEVSSIRIRTVSVVSALALSAIAGYTFPANAEEVKTVSRQVTIHTLSDNPKLEASVKAICADKSAVLSDKARKACTDNAFPPLTKALTFRSSGIGAEFNTLARQAAK